MLSSRLRSRTISSGLWISNGLALKALVVAMVPEGPPTPQHRLGREGGWFEKGLFLAPAEAVRGAAAVMVV